MNVFVKGLKPCLWPLLLVALSSPAWSEPVVEDTAATSELAAADDSLVEMETVTVSGRRDALPQNTPGATAGVTATELRERVFVNTEDALKNLPDLSVRKRFIGDRNALISGRSFGSTQAPRGVVYADGVLLSNFLGRFNAPRWNMVAPEELSRVDVLYGPFSALYPGNSIGATVLITTREPDALTASGRMQAFTQSYEDYGFDGDYGGRQYSVFAGNRWGSWSGSLGVNRLENDSQPLQYAVGTLCRPTATKNCDGGTVVTGAILDKDPKNLDRLILGPDGGALEDDVQDQIKGKLAYENESLRVDGQVGLWDNDYDRHGASFLRDAAGNTVTRGTIRFNDQRYDVADSSFGPQDGHEQHLFTALTARTLRDSGWNFSGVASLYDISDDVLRSNVPTAANAQAGTITDGSSGKGWWNIDLQASYHRDDLPHTLTVGYYRSRYDLEQERYSTDDWRRGSRGTLAEASVGSTLSQALYAQDAWLLAPAWTLTAGLRFERWKAFDGGRTAFGKDAASGQSGLVTADYDSRTEESTSPKLSIAYAPADWVLRYSVARGVRYPTVSELFQGSIGRDATGALTGSISNNNPDLKPEDSFAQDLTWERRMGRQDLRVSVFRDDIDDTILQQTDLSQTPSVSNISNVDRVVTNGIEFVYNVVELLPNVDVSANLSLTSSKTKKNDRFPVSEGKYWLRIPKERANLVANWRFLPGWNANLAARYSGRQYNELDNSDVNPDVFGGTSKFTTVDTRVGYQFGEHFEIGAGVENLTDEKYYVFHPYPGRTYLVELRATL